MQKKIIALAVAGLVSGAAFAQSNVTVYGIVDMGYQYSWDNNSDNAKSKSEMKSGGLDGSRQADGGALHPLPQGHQRSR